MSKKRVGIVTSCILLKTGFSNNLRYLMPFLWRLDKYELFHLNQGMPPTPDFLRFPWKNDAALSPGMFNQARFNADPAYQRDVSYGNLAVQKFIIDNKLDYLLLIEDPWGYSPDYYFKSSWWSQMKNNTLLWTTVDSLPVLPLVKEWSQNCPNIWFWASFGVKALQQEDYEKYKHLKWVYGCLDTKEWNIISRKEKIELRQKNNIDPQTNLFLVLGRNQLRKIGYPVSIETLVKFKRQYPEYKAKLHFHCSYSDQGFPLERLTMELGLQREDILVTYFCRGCGEWEIKPFVGEDQDCRFCHAQRSQITAGVTSTISNRELSKIIGISDACISCYTSGGFEYINPQALLCGLPLLCTEYSSGEDFVEQEFVSRLDGTFTYEMGTGFKKHVPNQNTMVKFYKKICEMSEKERLEIGKRGREWALKTFDVNIIGKKVEEWIDSVSPHNWDFQLPKQQLKNPNAQIENIPEDAAWVKQLYNKILNCEPDPNGWSYWQNLLKQGAPRDQILNQFRSIATNDNQKLGQLQQQTLESLLDKNDKKRLLITMPDSIGDVFLLSSTFESLRKRYPRPEWTIYLATNPQYYELVEANPLIDHLIPYNPSMDNLLAMEGAGDQKGLFNIVYMPHIPTQRFLTYIHGGEDKSDIELIA